MSIAVIVDTFPRWSERFIAREFNELARRGLAFSIYCLKAGDEDCARDPEFADLIARRVVLPVCFIPKVARDLGMDAEAQARRDLVAGELGWIAFRQIGCANSLVKLLREHDTTHVYAHFASLPSTLGWLAAAALNLPLIISAHARDVFVEAQLAAEKMRYARRMFTCNARALGALREVELKATVEGKVVLMRHGLPLDLFPYRPRRAEKKPLTVLAAGRFVKKKGIVELIDALGDSKDCWSELILVGDGTERAKIVRRVEQRRLSDRVRFTGVVDAKELRLLYASADVLAVPSRETDDGDSDGVPNALLEAFALGLPVIGTNAGSLGDVLNDRTGTVAPTADPAGLGQAIRAIHADMGCALEKTAAARKLVEEQYDIRRNIEPLALELSI